MNNFNLSAQEQLLYLSTDNRTSSATITPAVDIVEEAKGLKLYEAAMIFNKYYPPFNVVVGFIGNTLSLLVMTQVILFLLYMFFFFFV